ncbi:hypothetical protein [Latilactobacillus curvatus]|uniref:hypothetical protein n=1 Tax=Latilactobacillus curvatus TaxID=28038 RepID=UPI000FECA0E7|nr:hypothetical protein [Latilactobacillus curvatus]QAR35251.1 hypothetical protein EQK21_03965 [Latilactobacillus curvatus]
MRKVTIYTKTGKQCEIDTTESRNSLTERLEKSFKKRRPAIVFNGKDSTTIVPTTSVDVISIEEAEE